MVDTAPRLNQPRAQASTPKTAPPHGDRVALGQGPRRGREGFPGALAHQHATASTGASFGPQSGAAPRIARLFVILFAAHFFLDAAAFNQLSETANRLLNRFAFTYLEFDHRTSRPFLSLDLR